MFSFWFFVILSSFLCTQIANPFFWVRIFLSVKKYKRDMKKYRLAPEASEKPHYIKYLECEEIGGIKLAIIGNLATFIVSMLIFCAMYWTNARTFINLLAVGWQIAIINWISSFLTFDKARTFKKIEFFQAWAYAIVLCLVSISLLVHGGVYDYVHHIDTITFVEPKVEVVSVDTLNTVQETVLIQGYTIKSPINRNGKIIFPMSRKDEKNLSIAGYIELNEDGTPVIIEKALHFTPYQKGLQNCDFLSRQYLPKKQFYGDEWSFQIKPSTDNDDEVYFAKMYGDFASLRGGRIVEGVFLINAATGEFETYPLNEIPEWVSGISE